MLYYLIARHCNRITIFQAYFLSKKTVLRTKILYYQKKKSNAFFDQKKTLSY